MIGVDKYSTVKDQLSKTIFKHFGAITSAHAFEIRIHLECPISTDENHMSTSRFRKLSLKSTVAIFPALFTKKSGF